eukprot:462712_1
MSQLCKGHFGLVFSQVTLLLAMDVFNEARRYFQSGNMRQAREALLRVIENKTHNDPQINQIAYEKLGDVHLQLHESVNPTLSNSNTLQTPHSTATSNYLFDGEMYYNKAIDCYGDNTTPRTNRKPKFYIKYGNLLQYQLGQYKTAESMYLEYIKTDKHNSTVYFHYANALQSMQRYEEAKRYYLQCLEFQESKKKVSIHLRFGKLLYYKLMDKQNGIDHVRKCVELAPNITNHHLEYALMLKHENNVNYYQSITNSFEMALKLSNHQDSFIIMEYAKFLMHCKNDKRKATQFMQLASALTPSGDDAGCREMREHCTDKEEKIEHVHTNDTLSVSDVMLNTSNRVDDYRSVKYVVYDFDHAITCWDLYQATNGDINDLHMMKEEAFVRIFGWRDRIRRLSKHFESLLAKGIKISLLFVDHGKGYSDIVTAALRKAYLDGFFDEIHSINKESEIEDKVRYIKQLKIKHNLSQYHELLYIDGHRKAIEQIRKQCYSIFIPQQIINGLSLEDMENIETQMNIETTNYTSFQCEMPESLVSVNSNIYYDIKAHIMRADYTRNIGYVEHLDIIKWIRENWNGPYKEAFIEFASKYAALCAFGSQLDMWTSHEIVNLLLAFSPHDPDLNSRKAIALNTLGPRCHDAAETLHKKATLGRYISAFSHYGYFLFKQKRYDEARNIFGKALQINPLNIKALLGKARTFIQVGDFDNAEYYLKKAVAIDPSFESSRYRYGAFLYECGRYHEADKELRTALDIWPYSDLTHYMLALNCFNLDNISGVKYHLEQCLNINPNYQPGQRKYLSTFHTCYVTAQTHEVKKSHILHGRKQKNKPRPVARNSEKEFAIFWYDKLEMWLYEECFQTYYQYFIEHKLDNIESLFSMYSLKLQEIGIANKEHVEVIMNAIDTHVLLEYEQFKQWLSSIVFNRTLWNQLCDALRHNSLPIYSIESFYRNVSSEKKLIRILGVNHINVAKAIWRSYSRNFLTE